MPPGGFETTILASERLQTHGLDRAATGIGVVQYGLHLLSRLEHTYIQG
jgi:hypothetical protein